MELKISRQTALEVFGLKEDFAKDELNQKFRKLSKLVHPDVGGDENLFKLIMCCKEVLLNDVGEQEETHKEQKTQKTATPKKAEKEKTNISLNTLYNIYYNLSENMRKYDIVYIYAMAKVYVIPTKKKSQCKSIDLELIQRFSNFLGSGYVNFSTTLKLPTTLKKFKVRVEFMGETFKFRLSMKKPYHIIKYDYSIRFNTLVELKFE